MKGSLFLIRYHPLIPVDNGETDYRPLFPAENEEDVKSDFYLEEVVAAIFRLKSQRAIAPGACENLKIRCPLCGNIMRRTSSDRDSFKHGYYTCDKCNPPKPKEVKI